jgi:hypothetical protein
VTEFVQGSYELRAVVAAEARKQKDSITLEEYSSCELQEVVAAETRKQASKSVLGRR